MVATRGFSAGGLEMKWVSAVEFWGEGDEEEELRAASGRAGAAVGASRASRTLECGTFYCRLRGMEALLHGAWSSSVQEMKRKSFAHSGVNPAVRWGGGLDWSKACEPGISLPSP